MKPTKQKIKTMDLFNVVVGILLGIGKSVWRSTLSVLYLIVYSFLLFALINYYGLNDLTISKFLSLLILLVNNWGIFWFIFFISNLYDDWSWRK